MTETHVNQLRVVLTVDDHDAAVAYYRDTLGLPESAAFAGPDGARVVILEAGRATLELANAAQARFIAEVETGGTPAGPVRLAFEVTDVDAATATLTGAGAELVAAPVRTPWNSRNSRLAGPAGVPVTLFEELAGPTRSAGPDGPSPVAAQVGPPEAGELVGRAVAELVGRTVAELGGEAGVLDRTVRLAQRYGAAGCSPFVAVVAQGGTVVGGGVNTIRTDHDPSAHGEVVAIRDAARRRGSADLTGAVVYSSCEPCAICRTVAAAAGVHEIVFAAGRGDVPAALDPSAERSAALMDAVTAVLPGIARRGGTGLTPAELAAPFHAYLGTLPATS
ncbi:VOC family protein [Micromonospora fluostatini]|uniref:VOC family protein n=1 Tax=Micromonospora sp. JCM 30529 TaxID=3421643 RepID=UPI003D175E31